MDYSKLKSATLAGAEDEEAVTVDTRALIDKVLARYSGEWTTLRELVQNAADAQASTVTIRWETLPPIAVPSPPPTAGRSDQLKHVVSHHTIRRLVVRNDGQPFTKTDWGRIKRIAEGNPDETKIGAFGVGFYSVFADCEEPFISSGDEAMAFYWKGNALFTKKSRLPEGHSTNDTVFVLDYRNTTMALPNLLSVCQFLATSLTFVALGKIEFFVDDWKILALEKNSSPSEEMAIPQDVERRTAQRLMEVARADRTSTQISASYMSIVGWKKPETATTTTTTTTTAPSEGSGGPVPERPSLRSFFRKLQSAAAAQPVLRTRAQNEEAALQEQISEDVTQTCTSTIFLRVSSATISTHVARDFGAELERATKKPPPKTTRLSILTTTYDESAAPGRRSADNPVARSADVFASVLPNKKPGGRIFIGFPTMQTSGAGMHISAPSVIPTVEREAIDLNARYVRLWNVELLRAAGILARLAFSGEMEELGKKISRSLADGKPVAAAAASVVSGFLPEARHVLSTFTFGDSTPSGQVAQIVEEAFWTCLRRASIEMFSSRGVLPTTRVRLGSEELAEFVRETPVVPKALEDSLFVQRLVEFGLIAGITNADIRQELENKTIDRDQASRFLRWLAKKATVQELSRQEVTSLLAATVCTLQDERSGGGGGGEDGGNVVFLGHVEHYLNAGKIPPTLPLPPNTVPYQLTVGIPEKDLKALGWQPLDVAPWVGHLTDTRRARGDEMDISVSPEFAASVLAVISKNWENISADHKAVVAGLLSGQTTMPTKMGMRLPGESFFPTVRLFDDLPVVQITLKEKFLVALGVRKTLDLETIFGRLLRPGQTGERRWSHVELIKYLVSVRSDIPAADMKKLRESRMCPAEADDGDGDGEGERPQANSNKLYAVSELYGPRDELRALDLPLLQWPGRSLRPTSDEGRFLASLGLQRYPPVQLLVDMMGSGDRVKRKRARHYFVANHLINLYTATPLHDSDKAFVPVVGGDPEKLVRPSACFANPRAKILGFDILAGDLHEHAGKFGVARDPPVMACVERLVAAPPPDGATATAVFEYMATRLADLDARCIAVLKEAPFVPVLTRKRPLAPENKGGDAGRPAYATPTHCYLGTSATYEGIFDFVTFSPDADAFLFKCGMKSEPTKPEIAAMLCAEPARLLGVLRTPEKYLGLLKTLAEPAGLPDLKRDKALWKKMQTAPFCLAYKELTAAAAAAAAPAPSSPGKTTAAPDPDEDAPPPAKQCQLATARDVAIKDDIISYGIFKEHLLCAPEDDVLEDFYIALGAKRLGGLVDSEVIVGASIVDPAITDKLRKRVMERSKIFLHQYAKYETDIRHDARWLDKALEIRLVQNLSLRRTFRPRGVQHRARRSAASVCPSRDSAVLYVSGESKFDMFQVGQALCQLLLTRPSLHAYTTFEPILTLDLYDLRARGYDVDRILRAKAEQARLAEAERVRVMEDEQRRLRAAQAEWDAKGKGKAIAAEAARDQPAFPDMPGSFGPPSPPSPLVKRSANPPPPQPPKKRRDFFWTLGKSLGFDVAGDSDDDDGDGGNDNDGGGGGDDKPRGQASGPPPSPSPTTTRRLQQQQQQQQHQGLSGPDPSGPGPSSSQEQVQGQKHPSPDDGRVTSPAVVQRNLLSAVNATRSFGAASLFVPPRVSEVKEQATYCDSKSAHELEFAAEAANGTRFFFARAVVPATRNEFLAGNTAALNGFAGLLADLSDVYSVARSSLHIFYDESGPTIAFNLAGSLFCNLRYFLQLHHAGGGGGELRGEPRSRAAVWWWVVLAHELAHNLVMNHDSDHSYYTESFIQQYFSKMVALAARWEGGANASATTALAVRGLPPPPPYDG